MAATVGATASGDTATGCMETASPQAWGPFLALALLVAVCRGVGTSARDAATSLCHAFRRARGGARLTLTSVFQLRNPYPPLDGSSTAWPLPFVDVSRQPKPPCRRARRLVCLFGSRGRLRVGRWRDGNCCLGRELIHVERRAASRGRAASSCACRPEPCRRSRASVHRPHANAFRRATRASGGPGQYARALAHR